MNIIAANQAYSFLIFLINGFGIGIIFDIFRILRKSFKTSDFITYIEDILFWVLSGILTLYTIIVFNDGKIRLYILLAIIIGVIIYTLTISRLFIKFSVSVIDSIKKAISKVLNIIAYPIKIIFKFLKKVFLKPINFLFINIRRTMSKPVELIKKSIKKYKKNNKKAIQKKDFNI